MDFFGPDAPADACDICGSKEGLTGQGIWDVVEKRYSFYLCPQCLAEEERKDKEKQAEQQAQNEKLAAFFDDDRDG